MYKLFKRTHIPGQFEVQMAGCCDTGIARDHNEDAISLQEDDGRGYHYAIVCDGMGGHSAGEVASALAVSMIGEFIAEQFANLEPSELLHRAFVQAGTRIDEQARHNPTAHGMGCTSVTALGIRDRIWIAHAGDSRAYRVRDNNAEQLTTDHTMVQELVDQGLLTKEQAAVHPYRGRISRCLGHGKEKGGADVVGAFSMERGDNLLLCSDGLSDVVDEHEIIALVGQRDVRDAAHRLIEAANKAGGPDNISAIILRRVV